MISLVAGSYPPVMSPAADTTLAAARRELSAGRKVVTIAPRASGASMTLPLGGPGLARRLSALRRETAADGLILSIEPGVAAADRLSLSLLRLAMWRFRRVTLLVSDPASADPSMLRRLARAVDEIAVSGRAAEPDQVAALATAIPGVAIRVVDAPTLGPHYLGLSPEGPPEPAVVRSRRLLASAGRTVLGPLYGPVRSMTRVRRGGARPP